MTIITYNVKERFSMDLSRIFSFLKELFINGAFDFLEDVTEDVIAPVALLLNLSPTALAKICNVLPPLVKGELPMKDAIPTLLPIIVPILLKGKLKSQDTAVNSDYDLEKNSEKPTYSPTFEDKKSASEDLSSLADTEILNSINDYLQSFNAS